jgi:hypothetical protein
MFHVCLNNAALDLVKHQGQRIVQELISATQHGVWFNSNLGIKINIHFVLTPSHGENGYQTMTASCIWYVL